MLNLNPFAIATLLTALTGFSLCIALMFYAKDKLTRVWCFFNFAIAGWSYLLFLAAIATNADKAYHHWMFAHMFGMFVAPLSFHSICIFCKISYPKLIRLGYIYAILHILITLISNGQMIYKYDDTSFLFNSIYYIQANGINYLVGLTLWFFLAIFGIYQLGKFHKNAQRQLALQSKLFLISLIIGYCGGVATFLPMLGIHLYPYLTFLLPIQAIIMTYAIFRHNLFSIRIVLEKSIVYSLLIACISISYIVLVSLLEKIMRNTLQYSSEAVSLLFVFSIGLMFIPLRNKIQLVLDRTMFSGTPAEIANENVLLRAEVAEKEKFKAVATLASGIAHEVKNPLTSLKTFFEFYPEKKDNPEFIKKFIDVAGKEINRIDELANGLLDFAKPSSLQLSEFPINTLIHDTLNLLSNDIKKANIKLVTDLAADDCTLTADQNQIKQALLNIMINAIEAMENGGTLTIRSTHNAERCTITIEDTGKGMSKDELKHLFEPFYSQKETGTGLGMAITYGIIEKHNGSIKVASKPDEGTQFVIQLGLNHA